MKKDSHLKSIYKTLSWRFVATATTFLIAYLMTGDFALGASIAAIEFWAKMVLYYLHERVWS